MKKLMKVMFAVLLCASFAMATDTGTVTVVVIKGSVTRTDLTWLTTTNTILDVGLTSGIRGEVMRVAFNPITGTLTNAQTITLKDTFGYDVFQGYPAGNVSNQVVNFVPALSRGTSTTNQSSLVVNDMFRLRNQCGTNNTGTISIYTR